MPKVLKVGDESLTPNPYHGYMERYQQQYQQQQQLQLHQQQLQQQHHHQQQQNYHQQQNPYYQQQIATGQQYYYPQQYPYQNTVSLGTYGMNNVNDGQAQMQQSSLMNGMVSGWGHQQPTTSGRIDSWIIFKFFSLTDNDFDLNLASG